ncbi:MAG: ATP-dependent helicase, partial [Oscillospiraceae bacterium]|nr:ATP-dependent helicase [Oscillospiraceae bacterium]
MTGPEFEKKYMSHLNCQQREAVQTLEGPVLLLAVPGSGKTTVLVTRLGYMTLVKGIAPSAIMTITYTVAAAADMRSRFINLFGSKYAADMSFHTINSLALEIIRYYSRWYGKGPAFETLGDEGELNRRVRLLYQQQTREYADDSVVRELRRAISYAKNMELSAADLSDLPSPVKNFPALFHGYCDMLKAEGKMDFDDQLVYALRILRRVPGVRAHYQEKYEYFCVDEAQDTSRIQHHILKVLCGKKGNIFMVGDEDQSIYGFRAAYPEALLSFASDYHGAVVKKLEQNYRSVKPIVEAANRFIGENRFRYPKSMCAVRESGQPIWPVMVKERLDQYRYLMAEARKTKEMTAVLYRNNDSVLPLLDLLEREGIPYGCRSRELLFFNSRIMGDIRDIAAFAQNPTDDDAFLRIYYKLKLYLTKEAATEACRISRREGISIPDALAELSGLSRTSRELCLQLKSQLRQLLQDRAVIAVRRIRLSLRYGEYLEERNLESGSLDILELLAEKEADLFSLLRRLDMLSRIIQNREDHPEALLQLSTIHSAKGLEYDRVFLLDVLDGVLPSCLPEECRSDREEAAYEEERRLFYVAVTRAKNQLYLFHGFAPSTFTSELMSGSVPYLGRDYEELSCYHPRTGRGQCITRGGPDALIRLVDGSYELLPLNEIYTTSSRQVLLLDSVNHRGAIR